MSLLYECVNTVIAGENWNLEPRKKNVMNFVITNTTSKPFFFNFMYFITQ